MSKSSSIFGEVSQIEKFMITIKELKSHNCGGGVGNVIESDFFLVRFIVEEEREGGREVGCWLQFLIEHERNLVVF